MNVVGVKDHLAEAYLVDPCFFEDGDVPLVERFVQNLSVNMEFARHSLGCEEAESCQKEHDVVRGKRSSEGIEGPSTCLAGIVDLVGIEGHFVGTTCDVDLPSYNCTKGPASRLMGTLSKELRWWGKVGSIARYATDTNSRDVM